MGQICSGAGSSRHTAKDPTDKSVEAIFMKPTKIQEFDDAFNSACAPLQTLSATNNQFVDALEKVKECSALYQGEYTVQVIDHLKTFKVEVVSMEENGNYINQSNHLEEKLNQNEALRVAMEAVKEALTELNESMKQEKNPSGYELKGIRLDITSPGVQDDRIYSFNYAVFTLRKELALLGKRHGLTGALHCLKDILKEVTADCIPVPIPNMDGSFSIVYGNGNENIQGILEQLPPRSKILKEAFDQLQASSVTVAETIPQVSTQLNECGEKVKYFAENWETACTKANLTGMDSIRAVKYTTYNVKGIAGGTQIVQQCLKTVKSDIEELLHVS